MGSNGYDFDAEKTSFLRSQAELGWFQRTTMVFYLRNKFKLKRQLLRTAFSSAKKARTRKTGSK
jgi:hypothetical protein